MNLRVIALIFLFLSVVAGLVIGRGLNGCLDIHFAPKDLPAVPDYAAGNGHGEPSASSTRESPLPSRIGKPLPFRLVDQGAVGIEADPESWGSDYSHNTRAFEQVILSHPPYVDPAAFARIERQYREYLLKMRDLGYNGIVFHIFLELSDFAYVTGDRVYAKGSVYLARQEAMRENFGRLFRFAREQGMQVYLYTDMVELTPPLEAYFMRQFGSLEVASPVFWRTYRLAMEEIFDRLPEVDGFVIRIGEAGGMYNSSGWDYRSELLVTDRTSLTAMLTTLLPAFEERGKTLIFRTWSIGVGEIGNMHTNPDTYLAALGGIHSDALVVSTKYGMGDFFSFLPLNPTLKIGPQRRIVEFQARREFEGCNAFPDYMGPLYQTALDRLLELNGNIEGAWVWTQNGGPLRAGPLSLYPFTGFLQMIDANVFITARLLENPGLDMIRATEEWVRNTYGTDETVVHAVTGLLLESHSIVKQGLYIRPYAEKQPFAVGLEPPPPMCIWNIVSGSSSELSAMYFLSRAHDDYAVAVREGDLAAARVREWTNKLAALDGLVPQQSRSDFAELLESLHYETSLMETLGAWRRTFLYFYRWLDRGDGRALALHRKALGQFEKLLSLHRSRYGKNLDFPAYNFFAAEAVLVHARRTPLVVWSSRILLLLGCAAILAGAPFAARLFPRPLRKGLYALYTGLFTPWRGPEMTPDKKAAFLLTGIIFGIPFFTIALFSSLHSPGLVAVVFGMTAAMALGYTFALNGLPFGLNGNNGHWRRERRRKNYAPAPPAFAPFLALSLLFLAVLSVRGPLYFWYEFWTQPDFRVVFVGLLVAGILWLLFTLSLWGITKPRCAPSAWRVVRTIAALCAGCGAAVFYLGLALRFPGLDTALTVINNDLAVLPMALSHSLGITTHLNIPLTLPRTLSITGAGLIVLAVMLRLMAGRFIRPGNSV